MDNFSPLLDNYGCLRISEDSKIKVWMVGTSTRKNKDDHKEYFNKISIDWNVSCHMILM